MTDSTISVAEVDAKPPCYSANEFISTVQNCTLSSSLVDHLHSYAVQPYTEKPNPGFEVPSPDDSTICV